MTQRRQRTDILWDRNDFMTWEISEAAQGHFVWKKWTLDRIWLQSINPKICHKSQRFYFRWICCQTHYPQDPLLLNNIVLINLFITDISTWIWKYVCCCVVRLLTVWFPCLFLASVVLLDTTSVLGELGWKTYPINGVRRAALFVWFHCVSGPNWKATALLMRSITAMWTGQKQK